MRVSAFVVAGVVAGTVWAGSVDMDALRQRANELKLGGQTNEAVRLMETLAGQRNGDITNRFGAFLAEEWLAGFRAGQGELDHALQNYFLALGLIRRVRAERDTPAIAAAEISIEIGISRTYQSRGQAALSLHAFLRAREHLKALVKRIESPAGRDGVDPAFIERIRCLGWLVVNTEALYLWAAGECDEALAASRRLVEETRRSLPSDHPDPWFYSTYLYAHDYLANKLGYLWRSREAADILDQGLDPAGVRQCTGIYQLACINREVCLAEVHGVTTGTWRRLDDALASPGCPMDQDDLLEGLRRKAQLLSLDGRPGEAVKLLNDIIATARRNNQQSTLPDALASRADALLKTADARAAEQDIREALYRWRMDGVKIVEPYVYGLHGEWLAGQGRYERALDAWEQAYALNEVFGFHASALAMLLKAAALQLDLGHTAELAALWQRIDDFIAAQADLPETARLKADLARLDYLKFLGDRAALLAAYRKVRAFVDTSALTPYERRDFDGYATDTQRPCPPGPVGAAAPPAGPVVLQPVRVETRIRTGEVARARFTLMNPASTAREGDVSITGPGVMCRWEQRDNHCVATLTPLGTATSRCPLRLAPAQELHVFVQTDGSAADAAGEVTLRWEGATTADAVWAYASGPDARDVSIVNADLIEDNPYCAVPLYHEVYYRGLQAGRHNLRVRTSEPCRVEILDDTRQALMAIDASGDGDFRGKGDALYGDHDGDLHPDFPLSAEQDVFAFKFLIYPEHRRQNNTRDIEVTAEIEVGGHYQVQSIDTVRVGVSR